MPDGALGYHVNTKVNFIDTGNKTVSCANGNTIPYDVLVLATGSDALLPRHTPGHDAKGVFVYRTIDDLMNLISFAEQRRETTGLVVGGGLLGLEAAKAMMDLECYGKVRLIERNGWVMNRQLDKEAGSMVVRQITDLGLDVMLRKRIAEIRVDSENHVAGVVFEDGEQIDCSTVCFAIGVSARDELAKLSGIQCVEKGNGIVVQDDMRTNLPNVYAIGECASWQGQTFGLIAPGVEMADLLAFNLTQADLHAPRAFKRPDISTKLKLLGVDVASFGDYFADRDGPKYLPPKYKRSATGNGHQTQKEIGTAGLPSVKALSYQDPFNNVYKKYIFTADGKYLLGGMMIGDTKDYTKLVQLVKKSQELELPPGQLILGAQKDGDEDDDLDDEAQICSCHNVTKGDVVSCVKDGTCKDLASIKTCTKAGTGCGGCMPLVTTIFNKTMKAMGNEVKNYICSHFNYSRAELYHIVMVKRLKTLGEVMREAGNDTTSLGCETCKPAVGSIFASLWNRHVMDKPTHGLQDTNDRYLGNIQRNGTYSVIPRVSGGEITPDKLVVIGEVAQKYNLYTKITGGQRIDLFGARKQDLIDIWGQLVAGGMESGHAYAKSLRTVKSCVGSTWCRYGIGDSVGMAVRVEERYKSIRAPHKLKGGVSGCVRECAEAQSKELVHPTRPRRLLLIMNSFSFGLIATDKGFNIFVGGNGGAKPRHAELLARDIAPSEVIPILDRYLMFYIRTADRLQRTARWMESLPGGLKYLQDVILNDKLGICASLEAQMQELVDSFFDEWVEAIKTPSIAGKFKQFQNTDEQVQNMELETERDQTRPVFWPSESATEDFKGLSEKWSSLDWEPVLPASHFDGADDAPNGISATIKRGDTQLAVWRYRGKFYATQQMCPHKRAFVLSDGLLGQDPDKACSEEKSGDSAEPRPSAAPWVSCPHHKRNFDLGSGSCKTDTALSIATFAVEVRGGTVHLKLPPVQELDAELGTRRWMVKKGDDNGEASGKFAELDRKIGFVGRRGKKPGVKPTINGAESRMKRPVELMAGGCGSAPDW